MANPWFLFENVLADGSLTATSEASGYPIENVHDWKRWSQWKATSTAAQSITVDLGSTAAAIQCDTVIIAGHNGGTIGGSHRVQYSSNGTSYSTAYAYAAFADDDPVQKQFTVGSAYQYWRVDLGNGPSAVFQVGSITLGRRLELPRLDPSISPYDRSVVSNSARNENGDILGVDVNFVLKPINIAFEGIKTTEFIDPASGIGFDDEMEPHLEAGEPTWFAWNTDIDARDVRLFHCFQWDSRFAPTTLRRGLRMTLEHIP